MPTGLASQFGTHITLNSIRFPYRYADIERAVAENLFRPGTMPVHVRSNDSHADSWLRASVLID